MPYVEIFRNRAQAGILLATALSQLKSSSSLLLALPRGGVPVALEVSRILNLPLQVLVSRKMGSPENPEYAVGAVSELGAVVLNNPAIHSADIPPTAIPELIEKTRQKVEERIRKYRGDEALEISNFKNIVIVDDGIATGYTALAAVQAAKNAGAKRLILASPVCSPESVQMLGPHVDQMLCLLTPKDFHAVGEWYLEFSQVSDSEVLSALENTRPH